MFYVVKRKASPPFHETVGVEFGLPIESEDVQIIAGYESAEDANLRARGTARQIGIKYLGPGESSMQE